MLKIRVLGKGLIPRGYGLAPKKEPFLVDFETLGVMLYTPGLKPEYYHPGSTKFLPLTIYNAREIYNKYGNEKAVKVKPIVTTEPVPEVKTAAEVKEVNSSPTPKKNKFFDKKRRNESTHKEVEAPPAPIEIKE